MRKFTLLLAFLAFTGMTFAQFAKVPGASERKVEKSAVVKAAKAPGDVYWKTTFSKEDWLGTVDQDDLGAYLPNGTDLPGNWWVEDFTVGANSKSKWHWSDAGPRGAYTGNDDDDAFTPDMGIVDGMPADATVEDGFMMLEGDFFNTNDLGGIVTNVEDMDSYLYYGPVDLSGTPGVMLSLNTIYRFCCAGSHTFTVAVSNNYDAANPTSANWTEYDIKNETKTNDFTYLDERSVEINISSVARDQSSVYFRFHTSGLSHYFAIIDDLTLYEPPMYDLDLSRGWAEYMYLVEEGTHFWGGYSSIPEDVVAPFKRFKGAVQNVGTADATSTVLTTKIYKDGVEDESFASAASSLGPLTQDTLKITTEYTPTDIAVYQVSMTVANGDVVDENPGNNSWGYEFATTENTYSRVRHGMEGSFNNASAHDWVPADGQTGGLEGDMLTTEYVIDEGTTATFSGISVYIHPTTDADELAAIANGQYQMKARAFIYDEEADGLVDINLTSELYTLSVSDTGTWVYLPYIDEGELLQGAGDYYVGFEQYTGTPGEVRFRIGSDDQGIKQPNGVNYVYFNATSAWGWVDANFAIDLKVNMAEPVEQATLTINYDMSAQVTDGSFVPETDTVFVTGSFSDWATPGSGASVAATYDAATSIATAMVKVDKSTEGTVVEYKAAINSGWTGEEWAGDPNRTVTITDADVTVDHIFGRKVGVSDSELNFVKLYPNPFNSTLTLKNLNNVSSITLSNIVGQTIMNITDIQSTTEISTSDLESGVYVISIVDVNNNVRTERVVKQ